MIINYQYYTVIAYVAMFPIHVHFGTAYSANRCHHSIEVLHSSCLLPKVCRQMTLRSSRAKRMKMEPGVRVIPVIDTVSEHALTLPNLASNAKHKILGSTQQESSRDSNFKLL